MSAENGPRYSDWGIDTLSQSREKVIISCPWGWDHGFDLTAQGPSTIVQEAVKQRLIRPQDRVLDLGCGRTPRNAIYLSEHLSCIVDAVDLEPPVIPSNVAQLARERIYPYQTSVLEYGFGVGRYNAAVLARLIQYLSPDQLKEIIKKLAEDIKPLGVVVMNYTAKGGILNKTSEYKIEAFEHPIEVVRATLNESGFSIRVEKIGSSMSQHVPHSGEPAQTYDIIAQRRS